MEQFLNDIRAYAEAKGVKPSTVLQLAAGTGGTAWRRWESGESTPTFATVEKVRAYMRANPVNTEVQQHG